MAQKTLKKLGYKFDMVVFDMYQSKMKQTLQAFWHVTKCANPYRYYKGFSTGFNKAFAIDTAERLLFYTRPRELNKGDAERCYKKWYRIISETKSIIVKSVSCPTAETIGLLQLYVAVATISVLNGCKSSILPPPRATITTSTL